jgi:hypothetical protein
MSYFRRGDFLDVIPKLCKHVLIRGEIKASGTIDEQSALSEIDKGSIAEEHVDALYDIVQECYFYSAKTILSLDWDGDDGPCPSGGAWLNELDGVYIASSSDYESCGPHSTLASALEYESFNTVNPNPKLNSDVLPKDELLIIAKNIVDEDGVIFINGEECHIDAFKGDTDITSGDVEDESPPLVERNEGLVFEDEILKLLQYYLGSGSLTKQVTMDDGEVREYRFTRPTGMGVLMKVGRYKSTFGQALPHWVTLQHPYTITRLIGLAESFGRPLPDEAPIEKDSDNFQEED